MSVCACQERDRGNTFICLIMCVGCGVRKGREGGEEGLK